MQSTEKVSWDHFQKWYFDYPHLGFALDLSRVKFTEGFFESIEPRMQQAFRGMDALEKGAIANPDEKRMVGHYWLRAPDLAPTPAIAAEIRKTVADVKAFAADVHGGKVPPPKADRYTGALCVGIGGSALGP